MKALPTTASVREIRSDVVNVFAVYGGQTYAIVKATKYALGAARPIWVNDCPVRLISEQVFQSDFTCIPGEVIWLDNQYEILTSVDGSPAISIPDSRLKELRQEVQARDEATKALREERDKPRQEQERQLRFGGIKAEEDYRLATARRLRIEQERREDLRQQRQQAEKEQEENWKELKEKRKEREKNHREQEFFTKITSRQVRLNHDAAMLAKYSELIHHTKQLQLEQTLQATFTQPELQHTLLLEIELAQVIEHEKQNLSTLREEAELLESLAKEQEIQAEARQRQIAIDRQEAIDTQAADWNNNSLIIAYPNAALEFSVIKKHKDTGASIKIIKARAEHLKKRSIISRDSVQPSNDDSIKVGAVIGGVLGLFGGPAGAIFGAAVGGVIGGMSSGSESQEQIAEKAKWRLFISEIDEFINNC